MVEEIVPLSEYLAAMLEFTLEDLHLPLGLRVDEAVYFEIVR